MATGTWIYDKGSVTGGGGGTGGIGVPAPPVSIVGSADVIFRSDHRVEVAVDWSPNVTATNKNFLGVAIYLEDPDISSGANHPLDGGSMPLDGTAQVSGEWTPALYGESTTSPAVLLLDTASQTYRAGRDIRIYLAAYGPYSHAHPIRATDTTATPTPNILVYIPKGRGQGESGQEWAFLITNPVVHVNTDYNRLDPQYSLTLFYTPPDASIPVPPGINHFGGCRIVFVDEDANGDPIFPGRDTGINVPVAQAESGFDTSAYAGGGAGQFRVYFCSEDDSQPLGHHINSLVEGTTPYALAKIAAVPSIPDITNFTISGQKTRWLLDQSLIAEALFSWDIPPVSNNIRYAGVILYLVNVTGGGTPLTVFPQDLSGTQSNKATNFPMDVMDVPKVVEHWTIACISYDSNGKLADDPKQYGLINSTFHSPTVTWDVGPPVPGSAGSGTEFAPLVTLGPGAAANSTQALSSDGVGMVSFSLGPWVNPTDNQFGQAQVAMVVNHDTTKPTLWTVPANATSFVTPSMPSFGNIGANVPVEFYLLSDDPLGRKNSIQPSVTPKIPFTYTPAAGAIIPSRTGWFDEDQFSWVAGEGGLHADNITADNIYISKVLVVGGDPNPTFKGMSNGQIAVKNSSGTLRAWMGEQQPGQGTGPGLWGGWFGQIWIGGTNPLDAPLWVDNAGIIQVGGIAARQGSRYPYLSIRDQTGLEMGRIGASISSNSDPSGNIGPQPPSLTAGAWFTQLAVGGSNLSNWNILIVPDTDPSNPLGSQFYMRNIRQLTVDYALRAGINPKYTLEFGNNVWTGSGTATQWQFPGIHIYETDDWGGTGFGSVYLNRGMILRGTHDQGYPVLVSLVTYNGQASGSDYPQQFWGELAMSSDRSPYNRTVYLTSSSNNTGSAAIALRDLNNNLLFGTDTQGNTVIAGILQGAPTPGTGAGTAVTALAYAISGYGQVIDAAGNWKGRAIATGSLQTPWMSTINGAGFALTNAGNISAAQYLVNASGNPVIDANGAFRGAGVDVGNNGIGCSYLTTRGRSGTNLIDTGTLRVLDGGTCSAEGGFTGGSFRGSGVLCVGYGIGCSYLDLNNGDIVRVGNFTSNTVNTGSVNSSGGYTGGSFRGAGVAVGSQGIGCGSLSVQGPASVAGYVNCQQLQINGTQRIDSNGIYRGGLQFTDHVYGGDFGIYGQYVGLNGGFWDRDNNYHQVHGGLITT